MGGWLYHASGWTNGQNTNILYYDYMASNGSLCPPSSMRWWLGTYVSCKHTGVVGATTTTTTTTTTATTSTTTTSTTSTTSTTTTTS